MLVDDLTIHIRSGKGGDGLVAFNKNKMALGPTGGRGGNGGNIYFVGISDLGGLNRLRNRKDFNAEDGKSGHFWERFGCIRLENETSLFGH